MANTMYVADLLNKVDQRRLSLRIGSDTIVEEFTEEFYITCRTKKNVLSVQNQCTISIDNLTAERRNFLLGYFTQWESRNYSQPFIPVDIRIGRESNESQLTTVFRGAILETSLGNPPDITLGLKCITSLIDMNIASTDYVSRTLPKVSTHRELCQWAADLVNMPLRYEVSIPLPAVSASAHATVIQKAYSLTAVVGMLANFHKDKVCVFVDDGVLIVTEWGKALQGEVVEVSAANWLIGIPTVTQWGVQFTTLADAPIKLAGAVNLISELNPSVNQPWVMTQVEYDLTSRDTSWYATWSGSPSAAAPSATEPVVYEELDIW